VIDVYNFQLCLKKGKKRTRKRWVREKEKKTIKNVMSVKIWGFVPAILCPNTWPKTEKLPLI